MSWTGTRTIMVLELRQRVRATRWRVMLAIWFLVLLLMVLGLTGVALSTGAQWASYVPYLYEMVLCFVLGIGLVVAPTLSATSVNGDRADATLALLQATALRGREIAAGKLLAAWVAAIAFLGVALPFLLALALFGGATVLALLGHLLVLVVTLGSVCAVGLGFSSMTARTSASAVLTYLVVAALTVGTPLATVTAANAVRIEQTKVYYGLDYDASTNDKQVCRSEPRTWTSTVVRTELVWWMLTPNPFVVLGDISAHAPLPRQEPSTHVPSTPLEAAGEGINAMRVPQPSRVVYDDCGEHGDEGATGYDTGTPSADFLPFWPVSLLVLLTLGAGATEIASRRLAVPVGRLARGIRLA